jgi:hypothetical protein
VADFPDSTAGADETFIFALGSVDSGAVRALQVGINERARPLGVAPVVVDGEYGPNTHQAIESLAWLLGLSGKWAKGVPQRVIDVIEDPNSRSQDEVAEGNRRARPLGEPLTAAEVGVGVAMLEAVDEWSAWIHRRVVSYTVESDLRTVVLRHSVDCDADAAVRPPADWNMGQDKLLPLTYLTKWVMSDFDLRDERNTSMPLATKRQHSTLGAGVLIALAHLVVDGVAPSGVPALMPREIDEDLRCIARADNVLAEQVWSALGRTRSSSASAARWRNELVASARFMQLAFDISQSFLLTVVLPGSQSRRRVIKFKYLRRALPPRPGAMTTAADGRLVSAPGQPEAGPRPLDQTGAGHILIKTDASVLPRDPELRTPTAAPVRGFVVRNRNDQTRFEVGWEPRGTWVVNLRPGTYEITPDLANTCALAAGQDEVELVEIKAGDTTEIKFDVIERRVEPISQSNLPDSVPREASLLIRLSRSLGLRADLVLLRLSLREGGSMHLDIRAPDGLVATRGKLVASDGELLDIVLRSGQQTSLYLPEDQPRTPQGFAQVSVRPGRLAVGTPALGTAALTATLLIALAAKWWITGSGVNEGASLGLAVPGGFAAYAAQSGAQGVAREAFPALRMLLLAPGLVCFLGAAIVAATNPDSTSGKWEISLAALCAGICALLLALVYRFTAHPPEQRPTKAAQGRRFAERFGNIESAGSGQTK